MSLSRQTVERIQDYAQRYPSAQSAILPALWAVQYELGYVTAEAMAEVAQHLKLPPSLVEATSSFYSMYLTRPEGRHDVVICVNTPCSLRGADELVAHVERRLGVRDGQTTPDGAITWHSTIECLGACGGAPMMQVDHRFEENLNPEKVDAIFERLRTAPAPHMVKPMERATEPIPGPRPVQRAPEAEAVAPKVTGAAPVTQTEEKPASAVTPAEEKPAAAPVAESAPPKPKRARTRKAPTPLVPGETAESGAEGKRPRGRRSQK
jgi:NADH-quinone oxidoreductase subunit E